jgi:hypothetical protein
MKKVGMGVLFRFLFGGQRTERLALPSRLGLVQIGREIRQAGRPTDRFSKNQWC